MKKLQSIVLEQSPVSDLSVLHDKEDITGIELVDTAISDIKFIERYQYLRRLILIGCPIKDYSPLLRIPPLMYLEVDEKVVGALGIENIKKQHPEAKIIVKQNVAN